MKRSVFNPVGADSSYEFGCVVCRFHSILRGTKIEYVVTRVDPHSLTRPLQPPTQGSPFRSMSPATRIPNSPLIHTDIYLGLPSYLGLDVSASMTYTSEV
uniref:Uncharacterized protein n=1 Tax=Mesocestoides corti TaxID=53468 RepID=A0A5K3FRS5_MESCO